MRGYQKKLGHLDKELKSLLKDLENYSEAKLNEQPDEESWSVFQVMNHLILSEESSVKYIQKKLSFNPELKEASLITNMRKLMLKTYMSTPLKVSAPDVVAGDKLPLYSKFWDVAKRWQTLRKDTRTYLDSLDEELLKKEIYKHPIAGRMDIEGMIDFFKMHFERHRKQIQRTLKAVDAVKQQ